MKICEKCGKTYEQHYAFCPDCGIGLVDAPEVCANCGAKLNKTHAFCSSCGAKVESKQESMPKQKQFPESRVEVPTHGLDPSLFVPEKLSPSQEACSPQSYSAPAGGGKKTSLIAVGVIAFILIAYAAYTSYTAPRDLTINFGEDIETYVGSSELLFADGKGLTGLEDIEWTALDSDLIQIKGNTLEAYYDKNAFSNSGFESELNNQEEDSYVTFISGHYKKGLREWEGNAKVIVRLREEIHLNGQIYDEPIGARNSSLTVKAPDSESAFIYLESQTDSKNNISFIVDQGCEATVAVPCDTYVIYQAQGQKWYGPKILFGPNTYYSKDPETTEFSEIKTWTLTLGVSNGNSKSDPITPHEFPDSDEGDSIESV